jgi:hypothetical protein
MSKTIITIIIIIVIAGVGYWIYQSTMAPEEEVVSEGSKDCVNDDDCVVFGETGDCNCGCYNKDSLPSSTGGECFCSAPIDCKCVDGKCEGIFEGEMSFSEARQIAEQSECVEHGNLTEGGYFTGTNKWWIKMDVIRESCSMVCEVDPIEKTAKINWRCEGINSFDECVAAGYSIFPPIHPDDPRVCSTPDGKNFSEETEVKVCAKDGERFSITDDGYPDRCCEGLKEWSPIPDTRFSIADECYEIGPPSESNVGICIKCGDGICGKHLIYDENPCNCPEDCAGKNKSHFSSVEEFCQSNDWKISLSKACEETFKGFPICELCTP